MIAPRARAVAAAVVIVGAIACVLVLVGSARAREGAIHPILRPVGLLEAKRICSDSTPLVECRAALRRQIAATAWQRNARLADARRASTFGVQHALRLASALYGVPIGELRSVGSCESHLVATSRNRSSTAAGLFQFLSSTWARAGLPGFSVFDPYANAIAAARLVSTDGSWREWSCKP